MPPQAIDCCRLRSCSNWKPRRSGRLLLPVIAILSLAFIPLATRAKAVSQSCQSGITTLSLGVPLPCEIKGSETHSFSVDMQPGQYARIKVQRKGIDLLIRVSPPDSPNATQYENPAGPQSPISLSIIATKAGSHTITLRPIEKWVALGRYEISLEVLDVPTPQDQKRFEAEQKVAEGRRQQLIDTDDSRAVALTSYQDALVLWRELRDLFEEANTLHFIARTYWAFSTSERGKFVEIYTQVLERRGEDKQAKAYTLLDFADAYGRSQPDVALVQYDEARKLFESIGNRSGQAAALYGLGLSKAWLNRMAEAVPHYKEALRIFRDPETRDRHEEARTLHALGGAYDVLGMPQEARDSLTAALPIWRETGDRGREGNTYSSLAKLEMDGGNWQAAFDTYDKAFELYELAGNSPREKAAINARRASSLYMRASTYAALADYQTAFKLLDQSLALREPGNKGPTYMLTCYFQALSGEPEKALETCANALAAQQPPNNSSRIGETYTAKGVAYAMMNKHKEALELYAQALAIQTNLPEAQAITQGWLGESLLALGQPEKAFDAYSRAQTLWKKEPNGAALALIGMAKAKRARNRLAEARDYVNKAITLIEPLRTNVTSEALRTKFFATKIDYYELYVDLTMQLAERGDTAQLTAAAFEANEQSRMRNLIETLAKARIDSSLLANPELAALVTRYRRTQQQIKGLSPDKTNQITSLRQELVQLESRLRKEYPRYAALIFPQPLKASEVQKLLDDDTLLLEFALGQERSYVWAVTKTELHGYKLPPRAEIEGTALRLVKHLSAGQRLRGETDAQHSVRLAKEAAAYWPQAAAFSRTLFSQIPSLAHKKHLVIVADGQLQYLPFGALPAPDAAANSKDAALDSVLVKDHQISALPSASVLSLLRETVGREQPKKLLAVFADPVFEEDDPRIRFARKNTVKPGAEKGGDLAQVLRDIDAGGNNAKLRRLYASAREARQILELVPRSARLEAIGLNATRNKATSGELAQYKFVHFATHGFLDEVRPEYSGVVLSLFDGQGRFHDGYLRLNDIYGLNLPVDLVVLSACRTGLGKPVRGEGLLGLTRGFMYAGTRRVLASFWNVDDDATAELMKRFYEKMLKEGTTPAAALSAAQWSMSKDSRWSNPYYWAGFVLQGD